MKIFDYAQRFRRLVAIAVVGTCFSSSLVQAGPLTIEESLKAFAIADDLSIELIAAEPQVSSPVQMAFDEQGRLWVAEMRDYPNGPKPGETPTSTIRILRDKNGDGVYEHSTIFADELLFVTSVLPWKGGVIVAVAGQVIWMADTDGDDKVDVKQVWLEGFTQENPQLRANHPILGLDGWIYISNGLRGGEVNVVHPDWPKLDGPISLRGRDFRFNPHTGQCEAIAGNGQYGSSFDAWGNRIICSNRNPAMQVMFQFNELSEQPLLIVPSLVNDISPSGDDSKLFALTGNWTTSNLHAGQFTAACGVHSYQGSALPARFNQHVFCCDPTANLVHGDQLVISGSSFRSVNPHQPKEFLASKDDWFRPVNLTTGPDGALYVVDMYRAVIEHPQFMPDELKNRPDLHLGKEKGRIWRISAKDKPNSLGKTDTKLSLSDTEKVLNWLTSSNVWQREIASRLISESQAKNLLPELQKLQKKPLSSEAYMAVLSLRLQLEGLPQDDLLAAFKHDSPQVRLHAVRLADEVASGRFILAGTYDATVLDEAVFAALADPHSHVRFRALIASRRTIELVPQGAELLAKAVVGHDQPSDHWTRKASLLGLSGQLPKLLGLLLNTSTENFSDEQKAALADYTFDVSQLIGRLNDKTQVLQTLNQIWGNEDKPVNSQLTSAVIRGLGIGLASRGNSLRAMLAVAPPEEAGNTPWLQRTAYQATVKQLLDQLADVKKLDGSLQAVATLRYLPDDSITKALVDIARERHQPGNLRGASLDALKGRPLGEHQAAQAEFVDMVRSEPPQLRRELIDYCLSNVETTRMLLTNMSNGTLNYRELANDQVTRLSRSQDAEVKKLHDALKASLKDTNLEQVIETYMTALKATKLTEEQAVRGREIFRAQCAICHRFGEEGVQVGPDISDTRTKRPDELLISILDPNRAIDNNFFSYTAVTTDGVVHTGVLAEETPFAITLRQAKGETKTIQREEIEEFASSGVSFMPAGLEKNITVEQMIDLISFLKNWRYLDGQVPLEQQ